MAVALCLYYEIIPPSYVILVAISTSYLMGHQKRFLGIVCKIQLSLYWTSQD